MKKTTTTKITTNDDSYELEIKRFYLHFEVEWTCPKGHKLIQKLNHYISYPLINQEQEMPLFCTECMEWYYQTIIIYLEAKPIGEVGRK